MAITLQQEHGRKVTFVSLSRLVWDAVQAHGGTDYLFKTESTRGFHAAQQHINHLLTSPDFQPASDALLSRMAGFEPGQGCGFSCARRGLRSRNLSGFRYCWMACTGKHKVPVVLFYPGSARVGTDLRFYDIPSDGNLGVYNYRVRVYGAES